MACQKMQRTGLTEGSLLFNNWLKQFGLYREDTEAEFINWLYSTSGWYDSEIGGSYFDIDVEAVKKSDNYQMFLKYYKKALENSDWFHLMIHSVWHLNGQDKQGEFAKQFSETNRAYWQDQTFLRDLIDDKRVLVISSIGSLIANTYDVLYYDTPQTHFNSGPDKNSFETLERMMSELPTDFDVAIVSCGAYGAFIVDRLCKMGKTAATIGSGIYEMYQVGDIPEKYRPKGYKKIENGRYWIKRY